MDDVHCLPFKETGYFSSLICDYLDEDQKIKEFYGNFSDLAGFRAQIELKKSFSKENRQVLNSSLKTQYLRLNDPSVSIGKSLANIELLTEEKTFTITTGHQLCLFTGPLYFIYKIVTAINLCEQLKTEYPEYNFVPMYWMASEDHDFAEINHINFAGGRINWNQDGEGPVGRISTDSLAEILKDLKGSLGLGTNSEKLHSILEKAYLNHPNLADATRFLVHELFGNKGLVTIDADDVELKRIVIPYFQNDLIENEPNELVERTSGKLEKVYFNQIHPRKINLFYIKNGLRERIERQGDQWTVLNTEIKWTQNELEVELNSNPERFSPNVVLRPFYQELILPNLAYIGGGGELAYWFQLKDMFHHFNVPFPILQLRNSVLGISEKQWLKLEKLGLDIPSLFNPVHEIQNSFAAKSAPIDPGMEEYYQKIEKIFSELEDVANLTDKSMLGAVNAQRQKQLNGLDNLKKKLLRAEKRKNRDFMERIEDIHQELFPKGGLQERHDNFIEYYREYGDQWIEKLYKHLDPLKLEFTVSKW